MNLLARWIVAPVTTWLCVIVCADDALALSWGPETNLSSTSTDSETGLTHRPLLFDSAGVLHVAWSERSAPNQNYRILTRWLEGGAWTDPETIVDYFASDPGVGGGAKYPSLVETPSGELHLFWHDYRVAGIHNVEIFTKMRDAEEAWNPDRSADIRLTTTDHPETLGDNGYVPVPVVAPDGAIHVTWYDFRFDGLAAEILAKTRPAGGVWDLAPGDDADDRVTTDAEHSELVDVDVDAFGRAHAVWRTLGAGARVHFASRDPSTGLWSAPVLVDTSGETAGAPAVVVDSEGEAHVVWPDSRDGGRALFVRTREASGTWGAEQRLTDPAHGADEPSMTLDDSGTIQLVWHDGRVSLLNREVFLRSKALASPWDGSSAQDERISNASGASVRPSVTARNGVVAVLWKDARLGNNEIFVRIGGALGTSVDETTATAAAALHASPNPVRGALVRVSGAAPGALGVFDVTGRRVRSLRASDGPISWSLDTDSGGRVPPGVYFLRDAESRTARVTVAR